jgi:hypothetical protein
MIGHDILMVGTKKGAFLYRRTEGAWKLDEPYLFGHIVNHIVQDSRAPHTLLMGAKTGHLGPTVFRSSDGGRSWKEAKRPPAFPKVEDGTGKAVDQVFWLSPGHSSEPKVWWAGTVPHGLFISEDDGETWSPVDGFNQYINTISAALFPSPDGAITHSILIDPRDAKHMYVGLSVGGTFETTDRGATWRPLNKGVQGDFLPNPDAEYGHDPHHMMLHPLRPDRLWQQNHCGIYRIDRPEERWTRVGEAMPRDIRDIGFPVVLHPRDPEVAWVFPMDGTDVWPRTSPGGKPAVYRTRDGGLHWERQDRGLPPEHAWLTVLRQAFCADQHDPVGLYFGTTSGEVWTSADEGAQWSCIGQHLPRILSVTVGRE